MFLYNNILNSKIFCIYKFKSPIFSLTHSLVYEIITFIIIMSHIFSSTFRFKCKYDFQVYICNLQVIKSTSKCGHSFYQQYLNTLNLFSFQCTRLTSKYQNPLKNSRVYALESCIQLNQRLGALFLCKTAQKSVKDHASKKHILSH